MIEQDKNVCSSWSFIEHLLVLATAVTGCVSISVFASLVGILIDIANPVVVLKICVITAGIKETR